jgi:hypothetical protein
MHKNLLAMSSALLCLSLTSACASKRQTVVCEKFDLKAEAGDAAALEAEGDAAWKMREDKAKLVAAIDAWEKALKAAPKNFKLRAKLSRAHYLLADGYLRFDAEDDDAAEEAMVAHFTKGTDHAEIALATQSDTFREKFCSNAPIDEVVAAADKDSIPAMYWYASNLGKFALATSIFEAIKQKDRIKAMMTFIKETDPGFFYSAPYRYFGSFYTKIPFPSGDEKLSKEHFEHAVKHHPEYLGTKVLYASLALTKWKDKALFKKLLDEVVAFDLSSTPELLAENRIEQRKARVLLDDLDTYFE